MFQLRHDALGIISVVFIVLVSGGNMCTTGQGHCCHRHPANSSWRVSGSLINIFISWPINNSSLLSSAPCINSPQSAFCFHSIPTRHSSSFHHLLLHHRRIITSGETTIYPYNTPKTRLLIPSSITTANRALRLAWANTWFREARCSYPLSIACVSGNLQPLCTGILWIMVAPSLTRVSSYSTWTCFSSFHWYHHIFLKSMRVFSAGVCLVMLNITENRVEKILASQGILASDTEQCTYCLSLWCIFRTLLDNKILLRSGHPASVSWVIVQPLKQLWSLTDEK